MKKQTLLPSWKQEKENCHLHSSRILNSFLPELVFVLIFLIWVFYLEQHHVEFVCFSLCRLTSFFPVYSLGKSINSLCVCFFVLGFLFLLFFFARSPVRWYHLCLLRFIWWIWERKHIEQYLLSKPHSLSLTNTALKVATWHYLSKTVIQ